MEGYDSENDIVYDGSINNDKEIYKEEVTHIDMLAPSVQELYGLWPHKAQ